MMDVFSVGDELFVLSIVGECNLNPTAQNAAQESQGDQ